jgi:4-amino-4-deoxy-L-arabinose transferase-like glycosyltransferase
MFSFSGLRFSGLPESLPDRTHQILFGLVLITAIIVRVIAFQGYSDSDPRSYAELADQAARGVAYQPAPGDWNTYALRVGTYLPAALMIRLFGLSEISIAAFPFLISILSCLLAYLFGRHLFGRPTGLMAMAILAIVPIDVQFASLLHSDAIAAFWANLALFILWRLRESNRPGVGVPSALLSGALFGLSWLSRESVVYLIPFVIVLLLFTHYGEKKPLAIGERLILFAAVGTGALAVLGLETWYYYSRTGDLLYRLHTTENNFRVCAALFFDSSSAVFGWQDGGYVRALLKRLFYSGPRDIMLSRLYLGLPALALLGIAWKGFVGMRQHWLVNLWLITLLLMFNFMTSSFSSYKPLVIIDRYLYQLMLPAVLVTADFLTRILQRGRTRESQFWGLILLTGIVALSGRGMTTIISNRVQAVEREIAKGLTNGELVYTDHYSVSGLIFFRDHSLAGTSASNLSWERALTGATGETEWERLAVADFPPGSYILVNPEMIDFLKDLYRYDPPTFAVNPPPNWRVVRQVRQATLYRVGAQ